jgi:hypothetical protein
MNLSTVSFVGFMVLNAIVAGGVGYLLWRKLAAHTKRVHAAVAVAFATAFALGALWFPLVHVHTFDPVPANVPKGDASEFGKVMFAGFIGMMLLVVAGLFVLMGYAFWDLFTRKLRQNPPEPHRDRHD